MNNRSGFMRERDVLENCLPCRRLSNRLQFRCGRLLASKEMSVLNDGRCFLGDHVFPSGFSSLDLVQNIARENIHNLCVKPHDGSNVVILQQVCVQVPQMHLDLEVYRVDPYVGAPEDGARYRLME